eukprot:scaffold3511_cov146-Skeletonema_menzelii.AAC.4
MTSSNKSSEDETASTSSVLSDSTPDTTGSSTSRRRGGVRVYNNSQVKNKHKNKDLPKNNASTPCIIDDDEESPPRHFPPRIAFQIFELIELKRRCNGLYRRHQEKRRQSVLRANHSSYHSVTSEFESFFIDGELFV